jgi:hypothetical protein
MSARISLVHDTTGAEVSFLAAEGFSAVGSPLVPSLAYPSELAGIANLDVPPNPSTSDHGMPNVGWLPPGGALIWFSLGNVIYDNSVMPTLDDPIETNNYPRPFTVNVSTHLSGLPEKARAERRWPSVWHYWTDIPLGLDQYVLMRVFAGDATNSPDVLWWEGIETLLEPLNITITVPPR